MIGAWPSGHPVPLEGWPSRLGFFSSADLALTRCSPAVSAKPVYSLSHTLALTTSFVPLQQLFSCLHLCEHLPLGCPQTPRPWPPSATVDRRRRSIPASPRPGHRRGGLGGEARPRRPSRRARASAASAREWKPIWPSVEAAVRGKQQANSAFFTTRERSMPRRLSVPPTSSSPPGGGGHDRQICGASAECHTS